MTQPHPDAPAGDLTRVRYEVESELNPRYAETASVYDYYGVYQVVKYEADTREIIATYPAIYPEARFAAYDHAGRLQKPAASVPGSADAGDNGGGG